MRRGPLAVALLSALASGACLPQKHPLVGRACDDAHPCGEGLFCVALICAEEATKVDGGDAADGGNDGGPDVVPKTNLLGNGGFETGPTAIDLTWSRDADTELEIQSTERRTGSYAARLTRGDAGAVGLSSRRWTAGGSRTGVHCADVWVKGTAVTTPVVLKLLRWSTTTPTVSPSFPADTVNLPDAGWTTARTLITLSPGDLDVTLQVGASLGPGGALWVDDARIWQDATGGCDP